MMKKSASIVGLCLILVIAGCAGSDVGIPGADRVVSDLISENSDLVSGGKEAAEKGKIAAQKAIGAKCDARSKEVRNRLQGTTWNFLEETDSGGFEYVPQCIGGLCSRGVKVNLEGPEVAGSYAMYLVHDPTVVDPWLPKYNRDGSPREDRQNSYYTTPIGSPVFEDATRKVWYEGLDRIDEYIRSDDGAIGMFYQHSHLFSGFKLNETIQGGNFAQALCKYGNCYNVPRHRDYRDNMFAIGYEYPELFDKYPKLWPEDLKVDPLGCYQPPDPSSRDSTPTPDGTVLFTPEGEYASCSGREDVMREKFGGRTWNHPALNKHVCIFGFCEPEVDVTISQYVESGLSHPRDAPPPGGNVVTVDGEKYVLWGGIKEEIWLGAGPEPRYVPIDRHETYEDNMFALGHLYPEVFDRHPELWPDDLTEDPLGCYTPPEKRMNR